MLPTTAGCATAEEAVAGWRGSAGSWPGWSVRKDIQLCEAGGDPGGAPLAPPIPSGTLPGGRAACGRRAHRAPVSSMPIRFWPNGLEEAGCATGHAAGLTDRLRPRGSAMAANILIIESAGVPVVVDAGNRRSRKRPRPWRWVPMPC